jgi:antitoxin component YwqK of YwqJK toxin-antitoxin module
MKAARALLAVVLCLSSISALCEGAEKKTEGERTERLAGKKGYRELVYRSDQLVEERSYDEQGALLGEKYIGDDSLPYETRVYERAAGKLTRVEARNGSGVAIGSLRYHYDRSGRLLGLDAEGSFGTASSGMIATADGPQGSWTKGGLTTVIAYDENGRAVASQTVAAGKAASIERRSYDARGALSSVSVEDKAKGSSFELSYDAEGRLARRVESLSGGGELSTSYRYDKSGRLVEEAAAQGDSLRLVSRSYAEDGSLERVETRQAGELLLAVEYVEGGRVEELYDAGKLFVKASYEGGRKVKDEFYDEGKLLRTREYQ